MKETVDFGAPTKFGVHYFYVQIPVNAREDISIYEDFGFQGDEKGREVVECRATLARELWTQIKEEARRDFNARLKAKKLSTGSWITGKIKLDRFLGRELCILAWAAEHAKVEECIIITQKWLALRPEERWWLFAKTASEAGLSTDSQRGWRKALYCSLSDGDGIKLAVKANPKTKKKDKESDTINMLPNLFEGE